MEIIIHHFEVIDSTNCWALKNLKAFDSHHLTLVTADEQTAARGQYGRSWYAPKFMNLYASFVFFINEKTRPPLIWTRLLAHIVLHVIEKMGIKGVIKEPNDIFVNGKKIAGILSETSPRENGYWIVIGLGLNVNMPREECKKIDQPATSLLCETQKKWMITSIRNDIVTEFLYRFDSNADEK